MVWNRFSSVFSSENGSEWNSEFFFLPKIVWNGIPKFSLLKMVRKGIPGFIIRKWFGTEFQGFSLPRNGSERNSEVFLFRETGVIPKELPSVPSCFVFRGIIFLSENGNPSLPTCPYVCLCTFMPDCTFIYIICLPACFLVPLPACLYVLVRLLVCQSFNFAKLCEILNFFTQK